MTIVRGRKPKEAMISVPESDMTFIKDMLTKMNGKLNEMEISLVKLNQTVIGNKEKNIFECEIEVAKKLRYWEK